MVEKPPANRASHIDQNTPTPLKVACLIDETSRKWIPKLVRDIFIEEDAIIVKAIDLSRTSKSDKLIWGEQETGIFTVKSAYYIANRILGREVNSQDQMNKVWRLIWMANVIPKVKVFAWLVVQNIIPTCTGLQKRGLEVENRCSVCGESGETLKHLFFGCRFSISLWQLSYADILQAERELGDDISSWEIFSIFCRKRI